MQILVGLNWISFELLERQLVHEEKIQSTATDKISTITFRYLTVPSLFVLGYHWLPLATIDLVSNNREFDV